MLNLKALVFLVPRFFCQILAFLSSSLTKYGHVTWPNLQIAKIFIFVPVLHLILKKNHKMSGGKVLYFRSTQPKTSLEGENPPPPSESRVKLLQVYSVTLINGDSYKMVFLDLQMYICTLTSFTLCTSISFGTSTFVAIDFILTGTSMLARR